MEDILEEKKVQGNRRTMRCREECFSFARKLVCERSEDERFVLLLSLLGVNCTFHKETANESSTLETTWNEINSKLSKFDSCLFENVHNANTRIGGVSMY